MEIDIAPLLEAVFAAGELCRRIQAQLVDDDTLTKKDRSPVTIADYAAQAVICRAVRRVCPDIPVVAEESAAALRRPENRALLEKAAGFVDDGSAEAMLDAIAWGDGAPGDRFFTLDPIDGTKGFLRGDQYAQALALIESGRVTMGILGCPNVRVEPAAGDGCVLWAAGGAPAMIRSGSDPADHRIRVSTVGTGENIRFLESVESGHSDHDGQARVCAAIGQCQMVQVDSQVKYAWVARGDADVYLRLPSPASPDYRHKIWDHAAGAMIVEAAGGRVSGLDGRPLDFGCGRHLDRNKGIIATNGKVHDAVVAAVAAAGFTDGDGTAS